MVNKIFAKNIKSPESLKWFIDLSDRFVRLESADSNTISDVAMGAASGLSDHNFSFSAVFTHILYLGRKMVRNSGHQTPVLNPRW